ncbi:MAG: hypothetical protein DMG72_04245 [Acidobacteria bacterium]|nr:MAG: hypothetical protein DMG72_04245 [Acidobacteriota bacterium]
MPLRIAAEENVAREQVGSGNDDVGSDAPFCPAEPSSARVVRCAICQTTELR